MQSYEKSVAIGFIIYFVVLAILLPIYFPYYKKLGKQSWQRRIVPAILIFGSLIMGVILLFMISLFFL